MDLRKFDKRIVHRNIDKGIVTQKDYQKYIGELKNLDNEYDVFEVQPPEQKNSREAPAVEQGPAPAAGSEDAGDGAAVEEA